MANLGSGGVESYNYSVDVPAPKAWVIIAIALLGAWCLYMLGGKSTGDYVVKLADFMMQGAIITILFATLAKGLSVLLTRQG